MKLKPSSLQIKVEKAWKQAIRKVIQEHKLTGAPLYIWRNGKVVSVPPNKLK